MLDQAMATTSVERLLSAVSPAIGRILDRALGGHELRVDEAETLFGATGLDLYALCITADELRRRTVGDVITFVTVRNINFTNICYTGCKFCAFRRSYDDADAHFFTLEEIAQRAQEAWDRGATEVCLQGGLHPKMSGYHYRDIVLAIKKQVPQIHIHAFSPFEIQYGSQRTGMPVADFLQMLKDAGLGSLPGTAAEILDTDIRRQLTKNKLSAEKWVEIVTTAHRLGLRTTSTIMYGHIDGPPHWAAHLALLRDIQKDTGGFTEFVPLGFVHWNAPLYLEGRARPGPTGSEDLKMHAVARLMLNGYINNIQVSWVKLGPKFAQMCLQAGANDFGGTLMNEQISRSAGAPYGEYMSPQEFCRLIRDIGRIPAQRSTLYDILRTFEDEPCQSGS
jgi:FO synthase